MRINSGYRSLIAGTACLFFGQFLLVAAVSSAQRVSETQPAGDGAANQRSTNLSAEQRLDALPQNVQRQYQNMLLPAINNEDNEAFLTIMSRLVTRESSATINELEAIAAATGFGSLRARFTTMLIEAVEQGIQIVPMTIKPVLREYATAGMLEQVENELAELATLELMQDPIELPAGWRETEQSFWEVHVWKNRFLNMERIVGYAVDMQQQQLKQAIKKEDQATIDKLQGPFEMAQRVAARNQDLSEREAELRILDLVRAEEILRIKPDFEPELNAAFALQMHAAELELFFAAHPPGQLGREILNDSEVVSNCRRLLNSGRKSGGATLEKALLLRVGAHWWLRGRYGAALLSDGLLKPPMAMKLDSVMEGLYMPKKRPRAVGDYNPETATYSPGYDRRHFYTWAVEYRNVHTSVSSGSKSSSASQKLGEDSAQTFY